MLTQCQECQQPFNKRRRKAKDICPGCWGKKKSDMFRQQAAKEKNMRIIREGHLMFKTRKVLMDLNKKNITKISLSEMLQYLGLKEGKIISGRNIRDRKIIRDTVKIAGWVDIKEGNRLFFQH